MKQKVAEQIAFEGTCSGKKTALRRCQLHFKIHWTVWCYRVLFHIFCCSVVGFSFMCAPFGIRVRLVEFKLKKYVFDWLSHMRWATCLYHLQLLLLLNSCIYFSIDIKISGRWSVFTPTPSVSVKGIQLHFSMCDASFFFFFFIINNCVLFLSFPNHCIKPITTSVNIRTQFYLLCSLVSSVALSTYQPTELHVLAILVRVQD